MFTIPIVLFAYARPSHLQRTLACLKENQIPLLYVYSDAPHMPEKQQKVKEVREILYNIDWCEVKLVERSINYGLGKSILTGVTEVMSNHESAIIFEDDLICVPGTYTYLCSAMKHYQDNPKVMSVTGWTHPRVTPSDIASQPYFDGRAECWVWGTWKRVWQGMQEDAKTLMQKCVDVDIDVYQYGADLPAMAEVELRRNIWAVRFLYWHIMNRGLCLRPPHSLVEHIGFDEQATNFQYTSNWENPPLKECPPIPLVWPEAIEHLECPALAQKAFGGKPTWKQKVIRRTKQIASNVFRGIGMWA